MQRPPTIRSLPVLPRTFQRARRTIAGRSNRRSSMLFWRRILAGIILLLSAAGLLLSLAGGVGVWIVEGLVTARATRVFERIEAALDIADQGLAQVETSLARAAERLDSARE